jgi:hypothetical protein
MTLQHFHPLLQGRDRLLLRRNHRRQLVPAGCGQITIRRHHASNIAHPCYIGYPSLNSYVVVSSLPICTHGSIVALIGA